MTIRTMNLRRGVLLALSTVLAAAAASAADTQVTSDVTVQAERPTTKVVGRAQTGAPIVLASVQYRVSYSDLDMSVPDNAKLLKTRVRDAARGACADLLKLYPVSASASAECTAKAEEQAMPQVLSAIAAAEARKTAAD